MIETWLAELTNEADLLNHSGAKTFFNGTNATAVAVTIASCKILAQLEWQIEREELCGADHYPITIVYVPPRRENSHVKQH